MNQDGKPVRLSQFRGKPVLLFFYPKDETPGCTKEACALRDVNVDFQKAGAVVLGISRQDEEAHLKFKAKHQLPYDLLVDADGKVAKLFGVGSIPLLGWFKRDSILVGPDGKIARVYRGVSPGDHASEVLKDIALLTKAA